MLNGHMLVGVWKDSMIVRLGVEQEEDALLEPQTAEGPDYGRTRRRAE